MFFGEESTRPPSARACPPSCAHSVLLSLLSLPSSSLPSVHPLSFNPPGPSNAARSSLEVRTGVVGCTPMLALFFSRCLAARPCRLREGGREGGEGGSDGLHAWARGRLSVVETSFPPSSSPPSLPPSLLTRHWPGCCRGAWATSTVPRH